MTPAWAQIRTLWRALWRSAELDADMHDEMRFHLEMEAARLARERGLDPAEARRQAYIAFGGLDQHKEQARDTRGLRWLDTLTLDVRLATRMLMKYRGLTLVGGFAMAVAIAIGATSFEVATELLDPALPFPGGDRVVALQYVTSDAGNPERRLLHDFVSWREALKSIEQLGAFRTVQRNLVVPGLPPEPIKVAEMTATGFTMPGVPPLFGRSLQASDERFGAPAVVTIGHQAWRVRFNSDPQIVGRTIVLAGLPHTIVGVMPEQFRFPIDHQFWVPFNADPLAYEKWSGPELRVFGRLARGVTLDAAQAELEAVASGSTAEREATGERLRPIVIPYTREHLDLANPGVVALLRTAQVLIGAIAFVVAINLAVLIYARTATRLGEIAVRTALGASRRRIVAQLFVEALALSATGALAGVLLARTALARVQFLFESSGGTMPFWTHFDLSIVTVVYAFALAVVAAIIMGVVPALKATGSRFAATLHEMNARASARLGLVWTTLVVAQIAVAVAALPVAVHLSWQVVRMEAIDAGFEAADFAVAIVASGDDAADRARAARQRQIDLMERLRTEPGISEVTFSSAVPGFPPGGRRLEFEDPTAARTGITPEVSTTSVSIDLMDAYSADILAGRRFTAADTGAANVVIVNHTFTKRLLAARNPIGLRFRYASRRQGSETQASAPWHQIVGIVRDFPNFPPAPGAEGEPTVYHPAAPGDIDPVVLSVRFGGAIPEDVTARFRKAGVDVDPALQVRRVVPLASYYNDLRWFWRSLAWLIGLATTSVLLLSAAGIYALTSFTVAQRMREIGIRAALGAAPRHLLRSVFGRVLRQLALGFIAGSLLAGLVISSADLDAAQSTALLFAVGGIMMLVAILAALGPARRGLRVQPVDVLRADG